MSDADAKEEPDLEGSRSLQRHVTVQRRARYFLQGPARGEVRDLWFVLHGYGQLADAFLKEFAGLAAPDRLFVAPEGLSRFYERGGMGAVGASWMTKVERREEIADYVGYLDAVRADVLAHARASSARVTVLGFSQGGATASRWAALGASGVDRLITWAGGVPPDLDLDEERVGERFCGMETHLVAGARDEWVGQKKLDDLVERLRTARRPLEPVVHEFDGGHRLDRDVLARLAR